MHPGKNKILITGANGFLGYEIYKFLQKKYKVIGTSKSKTKQFIKLNYPSNKIKEDTLKNVRTVIHLASLDRDEVKKNINLSKKINIKFTEDLINKSIKKNVKNFIFFSTIGVYGHNLKKNVDESIKPKPKDFYSKLKYITEKKILKKKNIRVIILRVSNIIGKPTKISSGFLKLFLQDICISALNNNKIILKSDGKQYRDFLELKVLLKIIAKLLNSIHKLKNNVIFNISNGKSSQIIKISENVRKIIKKTSKINISIIKGKKSKEKKYQIRNKKIKNFLNINFSYNQDTTILNILKFLKKNENRFS